MSYSYRTTTYSTGATPTTFSSFGSDPFGSDSFGSSSFGSSIGTGSMGTTSYASSTTAMPTGRWSYRTTARPRYFPGSFRPVYESTWNGSNYTPLRADEVSVKPQDNRLQVTKLNLHLGENRAAHHTDGYEDQSLIVRRGQPFRVTLECNRPIDPSNDTLQLQFAVGKTPKLSKGTLVKVQGVNKLEPTSWGNTIVQQANQTLTYDVMPAADAVVGEYTIFVNITYVNLKGEQARSRQKMEEKVIILFNAWCKEDQVYVEREDCRQEFVMNETGRIYIGNSKNVSGRPWNFGQLDSPCLEAALYILEQSKLTTEGHGNPTRVSRTLSAMVNSNDENGVLVGNWSGNYIGGKSPAAWNGSVKILEEFMLTRRPVKFGQCWVFSGVTTTLGRALGLPTRSVTNFKSAHDIDESMTIDKHIDAEGRPLPEFDDSIWNFHVWNEAWFRRPDLPEGCDGWQAFDATPQEQSDDMMQCGPAPVNAIREGRVYLGFDARFIFAEVNGDYMVWRVDENGEITPIRADPNNVGCLISTKAVGVPEREDVTCNYKFAEGTPKEREAMQRASRFSSRNEQLRQVYEEQKQHKVQFEFTGHTEKNGDIHLGLNIQNGADEEREVGVKMYATATYYTGIPGEELGEQVKTVKVASGTSEKVEWRIATNDYISRLDEDADVGVYVYADVKNTHQFFSDMGTFPIDKPDIDLQILSASAKVGQPLEVKLRFSNPLDTRLSGCRLTIEGAGISREMPIASRRVLAAGETLEETFSVTPKMPGKREIIANLHTQQLTGINGVVEVLVAPK